jgi:hypothetical protein
MTDTNNTDTTIIDIEARTKRVVERLVSEGERFTALLKPEWEARRDTAKTLISLSSVALVFTITFSQSVIKPDTPPSWRYAVIACWLAFAGSLVGSLGSLWVSMTLSSLPFLITGQTSVIRSAFEDSLNTGDAEPIVGLVMKSVRDVAAKEKHALRLLRFGIISYGIALSILLLIGLRQLLF